MIPQEIRAEIVKRIKNVEQEHGVRVLYAIESGSRAWGFASPNSDFDVRFIYAHPKDWYLAVDLEEKRDVIEYDIVDDIDLNGWDLRKALRLFQKSNPALIEWLHSPVVYADDGHFASQARRLLELAYSPARGIYAYRNLAKNNHRLYLRDERRSLKRCLYVLRTTLCAKWIENYSSPPPVPFEKVRALVASGSDLDIAIDTLLEKKKKTPEEQPEASFPVIDKYLVHELERLARDKDKHAEEGKNVVDQLNALFHTILR